MSDFVTRSGAGARRLKFGGGGKNMEVVFGICLAGVIVLAIILSLWQVFWRGKGRGGDRPDPHYKCLVEECGYEFTTSFETDGKPRLPDPFLGGPRLRDCPKCGEEQMAAPMVPCLNPDCEKWIVRLATRKPGAGPEERDICPHCNKDQLDLAKERAKRLRKKD